MAFALTVGILHVTVAMGQIGEPVALVESVTGRKSKLTKMEMIAVGTVIRLTADETLVLSYFRSCTRETITGGEITVGSDRSEVSGGHVRRETIICDAGRLRLTREQRERSGVLVLRNRPPDETRPEITIYALSPILFGMGEGIVVIERLDKSADRYAIAVKTKMLDHDALDLAQLGIVLERGGRYVVTAGARQLIFLVSPNSRSRSGPLLGRLLRL